MFQIFWALILLFLMIPFNLQWKCVNNFIKKLLKETYATHLS